MHYFTSFSLSLNCSTQNEPHNPISHFDKDNLHTKSLVLATRTSYGRPMIICLFLVNNTHDITNWNRRFHGECEINC